MPWLKLDLGFFRNPKTLAIGADARLLYLAALCYAGDRLTDGYIPTDSLPLVAAEAQITDPCGAVERLVKAGLWQAVAGGHRIHDYFDYNAPAKTVRAKREAGRERAAARRAAKKQARPNGLVNEAGTQIVRADESRTSRGHTADDARTFRAIDTDTDTDTEGDSPPLAPPSHAGGERARENEPTDMLAFPKPGQRERAQLEAEPLYPTLVAAVGAPITQKSRDEVRAALDDLKAAGVTPEELAIRAANYPLVMGADRTGRQIPISATAIVNNWAKIEYCPDLPYDDEQEHRDAHGFREAGAVAWARRYGIIGDHPQQADG